MDLMDRKIPGLSRQCNMRVSLLLVSMTWVVEYQYWVYEIRFIFAQKWTGFKEVFVFFEMEECTLVG